jgi:hypothetical protein
VIVTYKSERSELRGEGGSRSDLSSDGLQDDDLLFSGRWWGAHGV